MRSPAERFARCRLADGADVQALADELAERHLDVVPPEHLVALQADLRLPSPFYPRDRGHHESQTFLLQNRLRLYFQPDADMEGASALVDDALPREFAETLIVAGAEEPWLAAALQRRGTTISARGLRLYKSFFFAVDGLDTAELSQFLDRRRGEEVAPEDDPRVRAARSRGTGLSLLLESMRSGNMPSNLQMARLLQAAQVVAIAGCLDASLRGDAQRSLHFSAIARNTTEVLQLIGDAGQDLQRDLRALVLETAQDEVPHISRLGGTHTTELVGDPETEKGL